MLLDLACDFAVAGSSLYGLGLAEAELLALLYPRLGRRVELVALDQAGQRRSSSPTNAPLHFMRADFSRGVTLRNASVAITVGISQRLRRHDRQSLMADVYRGLRAGGCALVMEVIRGRDSMLNNFFADHTRQRQCEMSEEIGKAMQIANTFDEEYALLRDSGFHSIDVFYKWYGLAGFVAVK
jgi:tRNA (cmo5U34)-methyltransferase